MIPFLPSQKDLLLYQDLKLIKVNNDLNSNSALCFMIGNEIIGFSSYRILCGLKVFENMILNFPYKVEWAMFPYDIILELNY